MTLGILASPTTQAGRPKAARCAMPVWLFERYFFAQERRPIGTMTSEQMSVTT